MRHVGTPIACAASTNSRDLIDSVWPRTTRAMSSHENAAMAATTSRMSRPNTVTTRMAMSR